MRSTSRRAAAAHCFHLPLRVSEVPSAAFQMPALYILHSEMDSCCRKHRVPMCRYFRQGKCTKGESCEFSHDLSHPDSFICPYFLLGFCKYGSRCQYDHKYPQVSQPCEPPPGKWPLSTRVGSTHSEVSSLSVESAPWRPSAARSSKLPHEGFSNDRSHDSKLSKAAGPAFFSQREASAAHSSPAVVSSEPDLRPICVYFQTGECQFGERCRFKHVLADNTPATSAAVATAEHAIRIAANLRNLETLPASKHRPQVLTSLNWSLACSKPASDMVKVAPVMQKSAWGNGLLVNSNPDEFPQTLPEPASQQPHGWRVLDDNVDSLDPWERSQHPSTIPLRPPAAEADAPGDLTFSDGGECMPELEEDMPDPSEMLCSEHAMTGCCPVRDTCPCIHGDLCPSCGYHCLHPTDEEMRRAHETTCRTYFEEYQRLEIMHTVPHPLLLCLQSSGPACILHQLRGSAVLKQCVFKLCL